MADEELDLENVPAETPLSPEEAVIRRHRREKRELQGKILAMKKAITKNDKKKKKDISDEADKMEAELKARHQLELESFRINLVEIKPVVPLPQILEGVAEISLNGKTEDTPSSPATPKKSKASKRREKKELEERERQKRIDIETGELEEGSDRKKESLQLKEILRGMNLRVYDIPPDGHCLYAAVSHQLDFQGGKEIVGVEALRQKVSTYLIDHMDDFVDYLDENLKNFDDNFKKYCRDIKDTASWGGEIEVNVLSKVLKKKIRVVQAEGPCLIFGDQYEEPSLDLIYHRHMLQLGAHYNSAISPAEVEDAAET